MHFVMSQMAGPSILAQSKALLYGLFRFAGQKHKSPLENIGEERKLGLKIQDNKRSDVQIYFAGLLPQTEIRASKLEQRHICLLRGRKTKCFR